MGGWRLWDLATICRLHFVDTVRVSLHEVIKVAHLPLTDIELPRRHLPHHLDLAKQAWRTLAHETVDHDEMHLLLLGLLAVRLAD